MNIDIIRFLDYDVTYLQNNISHVLKEKVLINNFSQASPGWCKLDEDWIRKRHSRA